MSDEQQRWAPLFAERWAQPFGQGPFFPDSALSLAHIAVLCHAHSASESGKIREKTMEKVVEKIVMLPQIVEVVKTIHEIS